MPHSSLDDLVKHIYSLEAELEQAFEQLLEHKREQFLYTLEEGRVRFDKEVHELQRRYKTRLWPYIRHARPVHWLTAPVIYSVVFPLLILDLTMVIYQNVCFRAWGVPLARRKDYIVIDRQYLAYLNVLEKLNCMYCGYGNGLIAWTREIIARTEQYWCPIKHAQKVRDSHQRLARFAEYGDAEAWRQRVKELREQLLTEANDSQDR